MLSHNRSGVRSKKTLLSMRFLCIFLCLSVSLTRLGCFSCGRSPSVCVLSPFVMDSNEQDVVVSVDGSDASFSGFSSVPETDDEIVPVKVPKPAKTVKQSSKKNTPKEKVSKEKVSKAKSKHGTKKSLISGDNNGASSARGAPSFDISKLSETDIVNLRTLLGIQCSQNDDSAENYELDIHETTGRSLSDLPRLTVEVDSACISDGESPCKERNRNVLTDMTNALFEEGELVEDSEWDLPRLKTPVKGKAVSQSLANMINLACTSQCDTESITSKYKVPENCDKACSPLVNNEIWKVMDKRSQTQDRNFAEIQNLVVASMIPILQVADLMKPQLVSNQEAKTLLADAITLMGQVQFHLSVRRRYMIRPTLKKKYHSLCNISMPITSNLFGDEVSKDIKACDSLVAIGKEQFNRNMYYHGRGNSRYQRRGHGNFNPSGYGSQRYQPYQSNRGNYSQRGSKNYKIPKKSPSATVTSQNE